MQFSLLILIILQIRFVHESNFSIDTVAVFLTPHVVKCMIPNELNLGSWQLFLLNSAVRGRNIELLNVTYSLSFCVRQTMFMDVLKQSLKSWNLHKYVSHFTLKLSSYDSYLSIM